MWICPTNSNAQISDIRLDINKFDMDLFAYVMLPTILSIDINLPMLCLHFPVLPTAMSDNHESLKLEKGKNELLRSTPIYSRKSYIFHNNKFTWIANLLCCR